MSKSAQIPARTRILIVDDDESVREGLSELLEDEGFAVAAAADGEQGLSWLRRHQNESCVVLLDLMMPVMDGFDFLKLMRLESALSNVPVVVMTAAGPIVEQSLRANYTVRECLAKPLRIDRLLRAIEACSSDTRSN